MTARADALVTFKKGGLLKRATLRFVLPDETDPNGARDGPDIRAFGLQPKLSARAIILVQIVAAVPLAHWFENVVWRRQRCSARWRRTVLLERS